jgi:hypothetical protein
MASLALTGKQGSPIKWSSQRSCMRACHHEMLVSRLRCGADRRTLAAGVFALRVPAARSAICCGVGQLLTPPRPISRRTLDAALLTGGTARPLRGKCNCTLVDTSRDALACAIALCRYPCSRNGAIRCRSGKTQTREFGYRRSQTWTLTWFASAGNQAITDAQSPQNCRCARRQASGRVEGRLARLADQGAFANDHYAIEAYRPNGRSRKITSDEA